MLSFLDKVSTSFPAYVKWNSGENLAYEVHQDGRDVWIEET